MARWRDVDEDVDEEGNFVRCAFMNCDKVCKTCAEPKDCDEAVQCPECGTWHHYGRDCPLGCTPREDQEDL